MDIFLFFALLATSVGLIVAILMQSRGSGLGAAFGGGGDTFHTRRGVEARLYQFTIVLAVVFVVVAMIIYVTE